MALRFQRFYSSSVRFCSFPAYFISDLSICCNDIQAKNSPIVRLDHKRPNGLQKSEFFVIAK